MEPSEKFIAQAICFSTKGGEVIMPKAILVIDDDVQYLKYMSELLKYEGYSVYQAVDGEKGISEYLRHQPQLIITDIVMPEKEGLELIMEVRKQDSKTPIIAVSGGYHGFDASYLKAAKRFGANATISKPIESEVLLATINELIAAA